MALDDIPDALGVLEGAGLRRVDEQDGELVAAVAGDDGEAAGVGDDELGRLAQRVVAGAMSELVVDDLEVVEVEEHQGQRLAEARLPAGLLLDAHAEVAPVVDAGERILEGQV